MTHAESDHFHFTKMHGLGNDFVIINQLTPSLNLKTLPIAALADRHLGIGFDQLLVIGLSKNADFFCRIFNADGSEAEQCGNGLRCVARFLHEEGLHASADLSIETLAGIYPIHIKDYDHIRVTLASPKIHEPLVELTSPQANVSIISTGNPHAILKVDALETIVAERLGADIAKHSCFPQGVNVGFLQIINNGHAKLRTYERGVGETYACGSNACAAAVAGIINGWLTHPVQMEFRLGNLLIEWEGEGHPVHMTGPAARVFDGAR